MVKLSSFSGVLAITYTDKMTIKRHGSTSNADGSTGVALLPNPVASNVPCRISFQNDDSSSALTEEANPRYQSTKVFCGPSVDIKKGDQLTIQRISDSGSVMSTYVGLAGAAKRFVTHQEIVITDIGEA